MSSGDRDERLRELARMNAALDEQVKQLVRTEQRLYLAQRDLSRQLARVDALNRFAIEVAGLESAAEIVARAADVLFALFALDQYVGFLADDDGRLWPAVVRAAPGCEPRRPSHPGDREPTRVPLDALPEAIADDAAAIHRERPQLSPLIERVESIFEDPAGGSVDAARARVIVIPVARAGRAAAVMVFRHTGGRISFHEELPSARDIGFLGLCSQQVAAALTNARLVERERLAAVGELAAVVAHEVRNPLSVIFNSVSILDRLVAGRHDEESLLGIVREESERLKQIVSELLEFARPTAPSPREESLRSITESAIASVRARFGSAAITLSVEEGTPPVWVDARMVRQALINLLVNAVQASADRHEVSVRIERSAAERVRVAVVDRGPGIPEEVGARMYEPFFTTKASGAGLGLTVVKRFAEAHGGDVEASPTPGGGATFTLTLAARRSRREGD